MIALLWKEWKALLPALVLVLLFWGGDLLYDPLTARLDELHWSHNAVEPGSGGDVAFVIALLGLIVSFSLFPREHDERTIEFLYSLPVTRGRIFLAKVGAAILVQVAGIAFGHFTGWFLSSFNHQTFTGDQFRLGLLLQVSLLQATFAAIVVAYGTFLSFFRRFGYVILGIAVWLVIALKEFLPALSVLDPTRIVEREYQGSLLVVPWAELALHGGLAVVALGLAYFLWMGPAERLAQAFSSYLSKPVGAISLGCASALVVALVIAFMVYAAVRTERPEHVVYTSFENASVETRRYELTYPVSARERALGLIAQADETWESVRAWLGASGEGGRIVADLTEVSAEHAGIAQWKKIRVGLAGIDDPELLRHVFAHETVHAFEFAESKQKTGDNADACGFFLEGLAEHVGFAVVPRASAVAASRLVAAAAWRRSRIRFDELASMRVLGEKHDPDLVYTLGECWCEGLERSYGKEAAGEVLRAMARKDAPRDLEPLAFWQDTLQAKGYDLERVNAAWEGVLEEAEAASKEILERLPQISGAIARTEHDAIVIRARLDRAPLPGSRFIARTRENKDTPEAQMVETAGKAVGQDERTLEFRVPLLELAGKRLELQLGQTIGVPHALPLYEDWQSEVVPGASR